MEKKRRLRETPIIVELEGTIKEYSSISEFCREEGFAYATVYQWLTGKSNPCIDIKITKVERR